MALNEIHVCIRLHHSPQFTFDFIFFRLSFRHCIRMIFFLSSQFIRSWTMLVPAEAHVCQLLRHLVFSACMRVDLNIFFSCCFFSLLSSSCCSFRFIIRFCQLLIRFRYHYLDLRSHFTYNFAIFFFHLVAYDKRSERRNERKRIKTNMS